MILCLLGFTVFLVVNKCNFLSINTNCLVVMTGTFQHPEVKKWVEELNDRRNRFKQEATRNNSQSHNT